MNITQPADLPSHTDYTLVRFNNVRDPLVRVVLEKHSNRIIDGKRSTIEELKQDLDQLGIKYNLIMNRSSMLINFI